MRLADTGVLRFVATGPSRLWAETAREISLSRLAEPARAGQLRHGGTWCVGLDLLPNAADGSLQDVPLDGPWQAHVPAAGPLHAAQVSIIYAGYPQREVDESESAHRYRKTRAAAHVDGLLPVGAKRRRFALEHHAYVLGIHLNECSAAPTVVWPGSHRIMQAALRDVIGTGAVQAVDVTDAYQQARRRVFDTIAAIPLSGPVGASFLLHRFALHGTAPWDDTHPPCAEGRMTAFFRPVMADARRWLDGA